MSASISFTVPGEPVGYLRMTQGEVKLLRIPRWKVRGENINKRDRIQRYLDYKKLVWMMSVNKGIDRAPKAKTLLKTMVYFENRKHPDAENVHKAISDALFTNDKMVCGSFDFDYDPENPRVEICISDRGQNNPCDLCAFA